MPIKTVAESTEERLSCGLLMRTHFRYDGVSRMTGGKVHVTQKQSKPARAAAFTANKATSEEGQLLETKRALYV